MGSASVGLPFLSRTVWSCGYACAAREVERAEAALREFGFRQFRVRAHGELARIEIAPDELARGLQPEMVEKIAQGVKAAGFAFVTIDLEGYRQGLLNSLLGRKKVSALVRSARSPSRRGTSGCAFSYISDRKSCRKRGAFHKTYDAS